MGRAQVLRRALWQGLMNIILFSEGESFFPSSDERAKHIRKVLHLKEGDVFRAGECNGMAGTAVIESDGPDGIAFSFRPEEDASKLYPLTLIVAQVRPICMRRILREAVSLGVERIILPVSDLGEKSYLAASLYTTGEYMEILIDGAMQSGRTGVSDTVIAKSVDEAVRLASADVCLLLDNVFQGVALSQMDLEGRSAVIAIGPERGWSDRERNVFLENGYQIASLGSRILRTETAAVAGVAVALSAMKLI